jgi:hypothetical protein
MRLQLAEVLNGFCLGTEACGKLGRFQHLAEGVEAHGPR